MTAKKEDSDVSDELISQALDGDIRMTHERFVAAMEARMPGMSLEMKETYFAILSNLVGKLENDEKPMRDILQEMMMEAGSLIMQQLNSSD